MTIIKALKASTTIVPKIHKLVKQVEAYAHRTRQRGWNFRRSKIYRWRKYITSFTGLLSELFQF